MKTLKVFLVLFILIASVVPAQCNLFKSKSVNKANDFISAGMTKEAIQTLKNGILENPKDHEAHWMLGKMYLEGGYYSGAEERFNSAILLKPDLKDQLGSLYKNTASSQLAKGNIDQAISLFKSAANYDAGLRKPIGQECYKAGKNYLSPGQSNYADKLFSFAKSMDGSLSSNIQEAQTSFGNQLLEIAKSYSKTDHKKYIDEAKKYISQSKIDEMFPPPTWKTVCTKELVGVGYTGGDYPKYNDGGLKGLKTGTDIIVNDRYTVINSDFEVWRGGGWKKFKKGDWVYVERIPKPGLHDSFRNEKGKKFTVIVQRFME